MKQFLTKEFPLTSDLPYFALRKANEKGERKANYKLKVKIKIKVK